MIALDAGIDVLKEMKLALQSVKHDWVGTRTYLKIETALEKIDRAQKLEGAAVKMADNNHEHSDWFDWSKKTWLMISAHGSQYIRFMNWQHRLQKPTQP